MELPANAFNSLTEATVEGWVKWERFGNDSRFFDFGEARHAMTVNNSRMSNSLRLEIWSPQGQAHMFTPPNALKLRQWYHIAVVTGPDGAKLLLDGMLVHTDEFTGKFQLPLRVSKQLSGEEQLGRRKREPPSVSRLRWMNSGFGPSPVHRSRSANDMNRKLEGNETGLVGLWNFDDGTARDSSPNSYDGTLVGGATTVESGTSLQPVVAATAQRPSIEGGGVLELDGSGGYC